MSKKWKNVFVIGTLAVSVALILWLTLFSRLGSVSRHFYLPFSSYRAVINGSSKALLEDIGNIVLFFPVGVAIALFFESSVKHSLLIGFTLSIIIECCQWFFWLGSFEIDDLIHNTIGAGIGAVIVKGTALGMVFRLENRKKSFVVFLLLIVFIISSGFTYQSMRWHEMRRLAAMNDRADGTKNLLILNPDPKYIGESDFNVFYNPDGSILIEGSAENRAWIEIGRQTLDAGMYSFSGLSGVAEKTIGIELEYYDAEQGKYVRLTPDVGLIEMTEFELSAPTKVRALIGLYEGAEGEYTARPVIYRKE